MKVLNMLKLNENTLLTMLFILGVAIYFFGVTAKQSPVVLLIALGITSIACWKASGKLFARFAMVRVKR